MPGQKKNPYFFVWKNLNFKSPKRYKVASESAVTTCPFCSLSLDFSGEGELIKAFALVTTKGAGF